MGQFPQRSPSRLRKWSVPFLAIFALWGAGVAIVPRAPVATGRVLRCGGCLHLDFPRPYLPPIGILEPLRAPRGLEPLRGGCHPRRPLPRAAPETGIDWFDLCTHRAPLTCTTGFNIKLCEVTRVRTESLSPFPLLIWGCLWRSSTCSIWIWGSGTAEQKQKQKTDV